MTVMMPNSGTDRRGDDMSEESEGRTLRITHRYENTYEVPFDEEHYSGMDLSEAVKYETDLANVCETIYDTLQQELNVPGGPRVTTLVLVIDNATGKLVKSRQVE